MFETPQSEHQWLEQFVGQWRAEFESCMETDQEPMKSTAKVHCRLLGGFWLIIDSQGDESEASPMTTIVTLGYDPKKSSYVGTFIASCMTYLWNYNGELDPTGNILSLDAIGPKFIGEGTTQYRDTVEILDADHWLFTGSYLADDGSWKPISKTLHTRV